MDNHDVNFTDICCKYLDTNPNIDITFSSYNVTEHDYTECITFEKNKMVFASNFSHILFPNTGIAWRQHLYHLIGPVTNCNNRHVIRNYLQKCLTCHLNISCCDNIHLYNIS